MSEYVISRMPGSPYWRVHRADGWSEVWKFDTREIALAAAGNLNRGELPDIPFTTEQTMTDDISGQYRGRVDHENIYTVTYDAAHDLVTAVFRGAPYPLTGYRADGATTGAEFREWAKTHGWVKLASETAPVTTDREVKIKDDDDDDDDIPSIATEISGIESVFDSPSTDSSPSPDFGGFGGGGETSGGGGGADF